MGENFNEVKGVGNIFLFFVLIVSFLFKLFVIKKSILFVVLVF